MEQQTPLNIDMEKVTAIHALQTAILGIKPIVEYTQTSFTIVQRDLAGFNETMREIIKWNGIENYISLVATSYESLSFYEKMAHITITDCIEKSNTTFEANAEEINYILNDHIATKVTKHTIISFDNTSLPVYTYGDEKKPTILLVLPCGMPWVIGQAWMQFLGENYHVITWETRNLFTEVTPNITNFDVKAQSEDMVAIVRHFDKENVHIFGMCGGAILTMQSLTSYPSLFTSASVWHGDYNWRDNSILTIHQKNIKSTMMMAYGSLEEAEGIRELICTPRTIKTLAPHLGCIMMYPFIDDKLLYTYSKINENIMAYDSNMVADDIQQKVLVVTSEEDTTAHPGGSLRLNERLKHKVFYQRKKGDHASLFDAPKELQQVFADFIETVA
ncbi:alpha/beta hydrolase family protein [Kordia jejudonensis]|uniref:alpha/beta hydrolase family protein n=1 Tax=Kordia jejudonensis TaxID=1348245 RepID=UPI0012E02648|nr:dienelactone hydrolase family protein [Kordia jejudonensis]